MANEILVLAPPTDRALGPVSLRVHQLDFALETRAGDHVVVRMLVAVRCSLRQAREAEASSPLLEAVREVGHLLEASASRLAP